MTDLRCEQVRLAVGADPRHLPAEVRQHLDSCAACRQFHVETLGLDDRISAALQLPLHAFRTPAPRRRLAMAASLLAGLLVAGSAWLFRPQTALAHEVVAHMREEPGSWTLRQQLTPAEINAVLTQAGVRFDTSMPVVYASPCVFRGRVTPHLVVQTDQGPVTVMLLPQERLMRRQEFAEEGYRGVLLPAGEGSVALLTQGSALPAGTEASVLSAVRW